MFQNSGMALENMPGQPAPAPAPAQVTIIDNSNIKKFIKYYVNYELTKLPTDLRNVPIGDWDVSNVTNMSKLFYSNRFFNEPLNNWDVSNVTNMKNMFFDCISFNQPLNNWNVTNVTNMLGMFQDCREFNQPLNNWNVSNVTNMENMFYNCKKFNQPLYRWNVSNVTKMYGMFNGCTYFNQSINNWQLQDSINMKNMFQNSGMEPKNMPCRPIPVELQEIAANIQVEDIVQYDIITGLEFLTDHCGYRPFIYRNSAGIYTGDAILWPAPSSSGKEFIECDDDTPVGWLANTYKRYIKQPVARNFLKINGNIVIKPHWYDSLNVPGTKFFQLVNTNEPVKKFMTINLSRNFMPDDYSALGSDHCNQNGPDSTVFRLEPITLEQLVIYIREQQEREAMGIADLEGMQRRERLVRERRERIARERRERRERTAMERERHTRRGRQSRERQTRRRQSRETQSRETQSRERRERTAMERERHTRRGRQSRERQTRKIINVSLVVKKSRKSRK